MFHNDIFPKDSTKFCNPTYFIKGMEVWARYKENKAIKCVVQIAAGDSAFIVNEKHDFSGWYNKYELLIKL